MKSGSSDARPKKSNVGEANPPERGAASEVELPFDASVGYQVRMTHRAIQRMLQLGIEPHGITSGMWYFLRVLWDEDGLTQRELSRRIGTMEPTTLHAIANMEKIGLVKRVRNPTDGRKLGIFLTRKGRDMKSRLLPVASQVLSVATEGFSPREIKALLSMLAAVQKNIAARLEERALPGDAPED
jgi:MarR family transcriptional regulator, organic hydroperoxide resistance regulator